MNTLQHKTQNIKNRLFRASVMALILIVAFVFTAGESWAVSEPINVNMPSQEEIVQYAQLHPTDLADYDVSGKPLNGYTIGYDISPLLEAPYGSGLLAADELICALNTVRTIRYIAGISDEIYLSEDYNGLAQASSIVNYANGQLTHTPSVPAGMGHTLANQGILGAKNSNIAWTSWQNNCLKWTILHGWMDDSDPGNISVLGHRRWILNPSMGMTGFGSVTGSKGTYNAMYSMDKSNPDNGYTGVCWPAANTPVSYFPVSSPWSISLGKELSAESVTVTMVRLRDESSDFWRFGGALSDGEFYVNNDNYGQKGCIIFRPAGIDEYRPGDFFYVSINTGTEEFNYSVTFFNLEGFYATEAPSLTSVKLNSVNKPSIRWKSVSGAESYNIYRKARGGSWKLLASGIEGTSYDDASAGKGVRYYYRVTTTCTVNNTEYESDCSSSKYVTIPLGAPKITSIKSTGKKTNYIKWSSVSKASGYEVYRRLAGTSKWVLMKDTTNKYYKNTSAKSGKKYQYKVRAYRVFNGYKVYSPYCSYKSVTTR